MPKLPLPARAVKLSRPTHERAIAVASLVLLATTGAAPGPDASQFELMVYSFGSAATLIGFVWIVFRLRRIIGQTIVVVAILLMFYLLAKLVVEAVIGG
jgi:apolipoprotein N-acyltransferase